MSNWIFVVTNRKTPKGFLGADDIYRRLMQEGVWGLGEGTPNRGNLQNGDRVVFYVGHPITQFAGTAKLKGKPYKRTGEQKQKISQVLTEVFPSDYEIKLSDVEIWPHPKDAKQVAPALTFIENKAFWGAYFQGGVRQLSDEDFATIVSGVAIPFVQQIQREVDIASESEFALEQHLEDFIEANWDSIDFGRKLKLYSQPDAKGRQYPAGPWSIDFLCTDEATGDFVVIELKRGRTSDAAMGQLARYIVWVQENLAKGKDVHGIIIAKEVDKELQTAIKIAKNISIKTYNISFRLLDSK